AFLAVGFVEGDYVCHCVLVAIQDYHVLIENRAAAEAVLGVEFTRRFAPFQISIKIITSQLHVGPAEERNPDIFAVGCGGRTGVAVEAVFLLQLGGHNSSLPENLAVAAVETEENALFLLFETSGQENAVAGHDRR